MTEETITIYNNGNYSHNQLIAAVLTNKITAVVSCISSLYIIKDILQKQGKRCCCKRSSQQPQQKQLTTMQRILIGMCVLDIEASIWFFIGSWALPVDGDTVYETESPLLSPRGNKATCTAQGFFLQSGLAIPLYQVSLTAFYYLTVCRNWKEERGFKKYQWAFHAPPILWGVSTGLYGAIDDKFNPALIWCFFTETGLIFGLFYAPLWLSFLTCVILQLLIYQKVRNQENSISKYTFVRRISQRRNKKTTDGENNNNTTSNNSNQTTTSTERKYSRGVMMQALYYVSAFFLTFIFPTILRLYQVINPSKIAPFSLFYLTSFFLPSQGLWNLVVYKRHAIQKFFGKLLHCSCKSSPKQQQPASTDAMAESGDRDDMESAPQ